MTATACTTGVSAKTFYAQTGKRWLDAACAFVALIILSPLFGVVALATKLTSRGPVLFRQVRIGQFGRPFRILKFRTMIARGNERGPLLTARGDRRITRLGRWLRKSKVDEIPQLINVLIGDMSLVGPRPEVPEYTAGYTDGQRRVFLVRPGITGPAANAYFNEEELLARQADKDSFYLRDVLPAKLHMDLLYCENVTLTKDLRLIFSTFATILSLTNKRVTAASEQSNLPIESSTRFY